MPDRVGVRELRQNLSKYLDRVKAGESLIVTERGEEVARLNPAETNPYAGILAVFPDATIPEGSLVEAIDELLATPGRTPAPAGTTDRLLAEMRDENPLGDL